MLQNDEEKKLAINDSCFKKHKNNEMICLFQIIMLTLPQNINHKENRSWIVIS